MVYRGQVKNGVVIIEDSASLPEGTFVMVKPIEQEAKHLWDGLMKFAGCIEGPTDLADNHDHYIHGAPRK